MNKTGNFLEEREWERIDIIKFKELKEFAQRVSVAGMEEAISAKGKFERHIWTVCLLIVLTLMVAESVAIGLRYKFNEDSVMNDMEVMGGRPEFPKISICVPKMANVTKFQEIMVIPDDAWALMNKTNVTVDQLVDYMGSRSLPIYNTRVPSGLAFVVEKVVEATFRNMPHATTDYIQSRAAPCSDILSNCSLEGVSFDCCSFAKFSFAEHAHCYYMNVEKANNVHSPFPKAAIDRTRSDVAILTINITTNWNIVDFDEGESPSGYYIHFGQASPSSDPAVIPTNMDATIVLAPAQRVRQMTGCQSPSSAPSLAPYFDEYDAEGYQCVAAKSLEINAQQWLCVGPLLTFHPTNDSTCHARMILFMMALLRGEVFKNGGFYGMSEDKEKEMYDFGKWVFDANRCPPLCTRWSYRVLSASYNSILQINDYDIDERKRNVSWSRIKILLPSSSYVIHEERLTNAIYLAVCEIGGAMGVYAGLSMVTFLEVLYYGPVACFGFIRRRRNKVFTSRPKPAVASTPLAWSNGRI